MEFTDELLIVTSCKGSITAKKIARELVQQQLSTNVRVISEVKAFFRWVGKVEQNEEHLLLIKSSRENYSELEKCIRRLHPHELPEITAVPVYNTSSSTDT